MELNREAEAACQSYLGRFDELIGNKRTRATFAGIVLGIIAGESLRASVIARFSPELSAVKHRERRARRLAMEESTLRSQLDAEHLMQVVRREGAAQLAEVSELTLILDGMELRRAGADAQESLMQVRGLDGRMVNGYRSFNVLGMEANGERSLLYHRLFSSEEEGFRSENAEWRRALTEMEAYLEGYGGTQCPSGPLGSAHRLAGDR